MPLIRRDGTLIPGGYSFIDPRTGMSFDGMAITFRGQAKKIIAHRQANPNLYPPTDLKYLTVANVEDELDAYICRRLGNNPKFVQANDPRLPTPAPQPKACPKCGAALDARLCKTCGGHKVVGYHCPKCGLDIKR